MALWTKIPSFERIRRFFRAEDGSVTIEVVLWVPVFAFLLVLVADTSIIFGRKAEVLRIVQDANRAVSIGRLTDVEAEKYVADRIDAISPHAVVETVTTSGVVKTVVTMPASDLTVNVPLGRLHKLTVVVAAEHFVEA